MANVGFEFKSKMKKQGRVAVAVLGLMALAACDPAPQGDTTCRNVEACEVASFLANAMRPDIGKDFGGGVVLRNTRALGQAVVLDVTLPLSQAAFATSKGKNIIANFGQNLARGFCEGPEAQQFFDMGSTLRARGFSRDGKLVGDQIIRSCRGIR